MDDMGTGRRNERRSRSNPSFEPSEPSETSARSGDSEVFKVSGHVSSGRMEKARKPALNKAVGRFGRFEGGDRHYEP